MYNVIDLGYYGICLCVYYKMGEGGEGMLKNKVIYPLFSTILFPFCFLCCKQRIHKLHYYEQWSSEASVCHLHISQGTG